MPNRGSRSGVLFVEAFEKGSGSHVVARRSNLQE